MPQDAYSDPDLITALYNNPADEQLLAEYALSTGGIQLGAIPANLGVVGRSTGGTGGGGGIEHEPCFAGETLITLFNGVQIPMAELYDNRGQYIGKGARAFTSENYIVPGEIRDVFRTKVFEVLHVTFEAETEPMRMNALHRFWTKGREFVPMREIRRRSPLCAFDDDWRFARVIDRKTVEYPEGIYVYNMLVGIYHDYFATQPGGVPKAVSNNKPRDP